MGQRGTLNPDYLGQAKRTIQTTLLAQHAALGLSGQMDDVCRYALRVSGKLLRPILFLEACRAVGGNPEQVIGVATGIEYGHVASLIHDDIIDQDDRRRGQPTVYHKYGLGYAILSGDLFIFSAFLSLAHCWESGIPAERIVRALHVMASSCIDMCQGQALEAEVAGDCALSAQTYFDIIRLKTACLFRAATESGAILGGGTDPQVKALAAYGENLGIAFQIVDDLLCYVGQESVLGKSVLSDFKNKRLTLPILHALQKSTVQERRLIRHLLDNSHLSDLAAYQQLVTILERTEAIAASWKTAWHYATISRKALSCLPDTESRDRLGWLVTKAVKRQS